MDRTYLYVPFEDYGQLQQLGAHWDEKRKAWYLNGTHDRGLFERWLGDERDEDVFVIESTQAFVASSLCTCWRCGETIEVVTIYCADGRIDCGPFHEFSVSCITAVDEALRAQLGRWPFFRHGFNAEIQVEGFMNHCPKCGESQGDFFLHRDPEGPFFAIKEGIAQGRIALTRLQGVVRLTGDEGFEI